MREEDESMRGETALERIERRVGECRHAIKQAKKHKNWDRVNDLQRTLAELARARAQLEGAII